MVLPSFTSSVEIDVGITSQASSAAETDFTVPLIQSAIARGHFERQMFETELFGILENRK